MGMRGNDIREEQIKATKEQIDELLPLDPSYKMGVEIIGKGKTNLRFNNYKIVNGTTPQMDIQASLNENITFNLGDIFFYDNGYWLCVEAITYHDIFRRGKAEECNYFLPFQNPNTLEVTGRWCSIRNPYSSGLDEGKVISVEGAKYRIKLPYDEETSLFRSGKRFLIDEQGGGEPMPYSIIEFDPVTRRYVAKNEGFLIINLRSDTINIDTDNFELMIADYIEPSSPLPESIGFCKIVFTGEPMLRVGASAKPFIAEFYDGNENLLTGITPVWELLLPDGMLYGTVIQMYDSEVSVKLLATGGVGEKITLKMTATDVKYGNFEYAIEIDIAALF